MLDVEAALARAEARAGTIDPEDAEAIAAACRAERFDIAAIGRDAADSGQPGRATGAGAARALEDPAAADHVHRGATSQDIVDTATMLVARRALGPCSTTSGRRRRGAGLAAATATP